MTISRYSLRRILATLLLCAGLVQPGFAVTLKIATISPDGTSWMQSMRKGAAEVEELTEGRVKLRFYPGGVMGNDKSVLRKLRAGQLHGGAVAAGSLSGIYPDIDLYSLPLLFRSFAEADYVRERIDPILIEGLKSKGFISYGLGEGGLAYFMCTNPVVTVDDLRQQKVWMPEGDEISRITLEALGVSPIPLPLTDVLTGLQTGLIDTVASSPIAAIALQWHTRVKYLTNLPIMYFAGTLVISERSLKRLTAQDRQVLEQVMRKTFQEINRQNRKDSESAMQALKKQGIVFSTPSRDGQSKWRAQVAETIRTMGREGRFSIDLYRQIQQHLEDFRRMAH